MKYTIKTYTKQLDGILTSSEIGRIIAQKALAKHGDSQLLLSAFNGQELYIKENNRVRESTIKEWKQYWKEKSR